MKNGLRIALLIGVVLLALTAQRSGLLDRETFSTLLVESRWLGPLLFVAAFSFLQPFGFPGLFFMASSTLIWPLWLAFLLNWAGTVGAGVVGFAFARFIGREWVERRLPDRFRDFESRVQRRAFRTVLVIRLTTYLFPPAHWALGLSPVRFAPFLLATIIGFVPVTLIWTFAGGSALEWLSGQPRETLIGAAAMILALALTLRFARRQRGAT